MRSTNNYRLYSFVANLYLGPLQQGLQTAHVVGDLATKYNDDVREHAFRTWAHDDKTIIICGAGNHRGVLDCFAELERIGSVQLGLPAAIFYEDEDSMNGMATACGVVVPQKYWGAKPVEGEEMTWCYEDESGKKTYYDLSNAEGQFVNHIKSFRLA